MAPRMMSIVLMSLFVALIVIMTNATKVVQQFIYQPGSMQTNCVRTRAMSKMDTLVSALRISGISFVRQFKRSVPRNLIRSALQDPPRLHDAEDTKEWLVLGCERSVREARNAGIRASCSASIKGLLSLQKIKTYASIRASRI